MNLHSFIYFKILNFNIKYMEVNFLKICISKLTYVYLIYDTYLFLIYPNLKTHELQHRDKSKSL